MFNHCMIHREVLASKNAINVIGTFYKIKKIKFQINFFCNEMGSDHGKLLLHIEVVSW